MPVSVFLKHITAVRQIQGANVSHVKRNRSIGKVVSKFQSHNSGVSVATPYRNTIPISAFFSDLNSFNLCGKNAQSAKIHHDGYIQQAVSEFPPDQLTCEMIGNKTKIILTIKHDCNPHRIN